MKVRIWYCIEDLGDGSAISRFFTNRQEMKTYIEKLEEEDSYDLTEGGRYVDIEVEQYEWVE